jgi:hypothetical protein
MAGIAIAHAEPSAAFPERWRPLAAPYAWCEWPQEQRVLRSWRVRLRDGKLVVEPTSVPLPEPTLPTFGIPRPETRSLCNDCAVPVSDGWIASYGDGLWWTDRSGRNAKAIPVTGPCADAPARVDTGRAGTNVSDVRALRKNGIDVVVLASVNDWDNIVASMIRISQENSGWKACVLANHTGADAVGDDGDGRWLVVGRHVVAQVQANGRAHSYGAFSFNRRIYFFPNSIVRTPDGAIYLGMQQFVARLTDVGTTKLREELFVPDDFLLPPGARACGPTDMH